MYNDTILSVFAQVVPRIHPVSLDNMNDENDDTTELEFSTFARCYPGEKK